MIVNKFKTTYFLKMTVEVLALILERFSSKDVSEGFQTTFAQADESDTEGGYIFTEGKVWEQIRSDILRKSSEHPDYIFRDGICHSRHSRRECKIFASGVNFSRNNAINKRNESKK